MNVKLRAFLAGAAGAILAFGVVELIHGFYQLVPSITTAVSQRIIELTPGDLATAGIGALGKAATPILITSLIVFTVLSAGLLANLALRSGILALAGVSVFGAVALLAAFSEPFVAPLATIGAVLVALAAGTVSAAGLMQGSVLPAASESSQDDGKGSGKPEPQPFDGRSRETGAANIAVNRRNFLALTGAAAAAGATAFGVGRVLGGEDASAASSPGSLDSLGSASGGTTGGSTTGGATVPARQTLPPPPDAASINVEGMPELITPTDNFYLIDTAVSSPRINRDSWTVSVKGAVDNPIELSYDELISSFQIIEADVTMSCVSNEVGGGLISHGRWTGVRLSDVLEEAGMSRDKIRKASEQLVGRSVDGWTGGFRTETAFDGREALVAFGLNGDELPVKHGYPVRLVIPGLYGYVSATKWLQEIELTDWGFDAYWIKRGWSKTGPVKTQSRIDTVSGNDDLSAGTIPIGGVAWAPTRGISRVEVSTDDGETWNEARLAEQLDVDAWRQYVYEWDAEPGDYTIKVRATDGDGETQTNKKAPPIPSGATGYHTVNVSVA